MQNNYKITTIEDKHNKKDTQTLSNSQDPMGQVTIETKEN